MMRWIVGSSLKYHFLVITLAAVLMLVGVYQTGNMPVDALPEFSPPFVEIQTEALGLSAEEVEQMITVPMEQDLLAGVAWLDVIRSKSVPGLSSVVIYFEPGTDIFRARQIVSERLAQAAVGIPHVSKPPAMIQPTSSASRFMIVGLSSEELSLIEMSVMARWVIGPRLLGVPGVANVAIWGNRDQQLQVLVDPDRLRDLGVTLSQVVETTGNALWVTPLTFLEASTPGTGGFIDTPNQRLGIWHVLPINTPDDLAQVPVDRTALKLGDLAEIVEDHQPLIGDAIKNESTNLLLVIEKLPGANILEVTQGMEAALAVLRPGFSGIDFDATIFRPATFVEMAIANLTQSLVIAAVLVTLFLGLFFYGWRTAFISIIAILASLVTALYVLYLRGATLNAMVLAGLVIALGVIIDDAVVDVSAFIRRLRQNRAEGSPMSTEAVILEASSDLRGTLFFATLILLLSVIPVFFLPGVSGALFEPLVLSYILAVFAAMVVSLTITPVLSMWILPGSNLEPESLLASRLQGWYERVLSRTLQTPRLAYGIVVALVALGLVVIPTFNFDQIIPPFKEPYITIQMDGAPGTSRPEMDRIVTLASRELRSIEGVNNVAAHVGRAVLGDQVVGINSAELWVSLDPRANYNATLASIQEVVNDFPGLDREVRTYLQQSIARIQTQTLDVYTVRVYGEDHQVLRSEVEKVQQVVAGVEGVVDASALLPQEEPTVEIEVDLNAAQRFGVKPGDVRRAASILLSGLQVGSLFEEQKVFDVVVWSTPASRQNLSDIRNLLIDTPGGGHVRLGEVAEVRISPAPVVINREAASPYMDVAFNISGRNAGAVLDDIEAAMLSYPFPLEYHAEVQRDLLGQQQALQGSLISAVIALIGILLLLQAATENWKMAIAALLVLPAALVGGLVAAGLSGGSLSSAPLFGLFAVLGISARNIILQIKHYYTLGQEGEPFGIDQVLRGSRERLTPMLVSVLTTGLAVLPFVIFGIIPGLEIARPTAFVILGGLVTTTLINMFVIPSLYLRFGASREAALGFNTAPAAAD